MVFHSRVGSNVIISNNRRTIEKKKPHAWMYFHGSIWSNGTHMRCNYGVNNHDLPAGTRFGVMKKSSGDVHFFINGEDKGSAVSGICGPVYGVADLLYNAEKITILKP